MLAALSRMAVYSRVLPPYMREKNPLHQVACVGLLREFTRHKPSCQVKSGLAASARSNPNKGENLLFIHVMRARENVHKTARLDDIKTKFFSISKWYKT